MIVEIQILISVGIMLEEVQYGLMVHLEVMEVLVHLVVVAAVLATLSVGKLNDFQNNRFKIKFRTKHFSIDAHLCHVNLAIEMMEIGETVAVIVSAKINNNRANA